VAAAGRADAPEAGGDTSAPRPKTARGEATRRAILSAAETVIGRQGYSEASIGAITREAGVAQGTFYIYFASKDEVFSELVADMGRMLRHVINEATAGFDDRLAAEREGLRAFLTFVSTHPELYRIVQEAQFVDPAAYRAYFRTFAEGYRAGLEKAAAAGELRPGDATIRAWTLMGIARSLGEYQVVFEGGAAIDDLVASAHDLLENGLRCGRGPAGGDDG
jgi:AcrR family transcriptional regulator